MAKITVDGQEFDTDKLPDQVRNQISVLRAADREIQRLNVQLTLAQTARNAIAKAVKAALNQEKS